MFINYSKGVEDIYRIVRIDGKDKPGEEHENCMYYVLDLNHDRYALPALHSYAGACRSEYPELAEELERLIGMCSANATRDS